MGEPASTILIVDDHRGERFLARSLLEGWGYAAVEAAGGAEALAFLADARELPSLVVSDQLMPEMDGLGLLAEIRERYPDLPFVMLTAYGSIDKAVATMRSGADDYLTKPVNAEEFRRTVARSLKISRLSRENRELKSYLNDMFGFGNIVTRSSNMGAVMALAAKAAEVPGMPVAIFGESGTGKELLARAIHAASGCLESRFVGLNCAGIPEGLMESELFGHVKGAFTGAGGEREGKFALARQGTLLLDEIGDMPMALQAKLLRVLQERVYEKVGSDRPVPADARVIAATHRDLKSRVKSGAFREDLFHRINVFPIVLPPLRERKEDILPLAEFFIDRFRRDVGKAVPGLSQSAAEWLLEYSWPGNVRELKNCVERAIILTDGELIRTGHLANGTRTGSSPPADDDPDRIRIRMDFSPEEFSLDAVIGGALKMALERFDNNKVQAAEFLKVGRNIFYRRKI